MPRSVERELEEGAARAEGLGWTAVQEHINTLAANLAVDVQ